MKFSASFSEQIYIFCNAFTETCKIGIKCIYRIDHKLGIKEFPE